MSSRNTLPTEVSYQKLNTLFLNNFLCFYRPSCQVSNDKIIMFSSDHNRNFVFRAPWENNSDTDRSFATGLRHLEHRNH